MSFKYVNDVPEDYEPCGECGWDHEYEPQQAIAWHKANPCSYCTFDKVKGVHESSCSTQWHNLRRVA